MILGTSAAWRQNPLRYPEQLVRNYGPAVRFHFVLGRVAHLFTHPDHYQRILQDNQANYTKNHPVYAVLSIALGGGLVTLEGSRWKQHRRLMQPAFHRSRISGLGDLVVRQTMAMLERWERAGATPARPLAIPVDSEMRDLTLGIVGQALFGTSLSTHAELVDREFTAFSQGLLQVLTDPVALFTVRWPLLPSARRLHAAARRVRAGVDDVVAARQSGMTASADDSDLLGMLLGAHDADTGDGLSAADIRDEVITLMFAGHETSATALTWTFYLINEHPSTEKALREELDRVLGSRPPSTEDIGALVLTRAVVQEAMRLYPPIYSFDRTSIEADRIGGYDVPAGAFISLCPYITHRMPEFWEAPERFRPERFLPPNAPPRFAYLPFSAGARQCIGATFAMTEMVLVLATVMQRYRLRLAPGAVVEPMPGITLRPRRGLPMLVVPTADGR